MRFICGMINTRVNFKNLQSLSQAPINNHLQPIIKWLGIITYKTPITGSQEVDGSIPFSSTRGKVRGYRAEMQM